MVHSRSMHFFSACNKGSNQTAPERRLVCVYTRIYVFRIGSKHYSCCMHFAPMPHEESCLRGASVQSEYDNNVFGLGNASHQIYPELRLSRIFGDETQHISSLKKTWFRTSLETPRHLITACQGGS